MPRDGAPVAAALPAHLQSAATGMVTDVTGDGIVGTVEYMAPEQAKGSAVDQRADIYAFGLILYDMLVGRARRAPGERAIAELQAPDGAGAAAGALDRAGRSRRRSTRSSRAASSRIRTSAFRRRPSWTRRSIASTTRASRSPSSASSA